MTRARILIWTLENCRHRELGVFRCSLLPAWPWAQLLELTSVQMLELPSVAHEIRLQMFLEYAQVRVSLFDENELHENKIRRVTRCTHYRNGGGLRSRNCRLLIECIMQMFSDRAFSFQV